MEHEKYSQSFRNRLKALRKKNGMSQCELADRLGISNKTYSKWENGDIDLSLASILKLADIFEVSPTELLFDGTKKHEYTFELSDRYHGEVAAYLTVLGNAELLRLISKVIQSEGFGEFSVDHAAALSGISFDIADDLICSGEKVGIFEKRVVCLGSARVTVFRFAQGQKLFELLRIVYSCFEKDDEERENTDAF